MINNYFKINKSKIGLKIYSPSFNKDLRGNIWTSFKSEYFNKRKFNHDKFTFAKQNTLRGLHGDNSTWKIITCVYGEIFAAIVQNDKKSKEFNNHETYKLSDKNKLIILIPPKMLLGWCCISKNSVVSYKFSYEGSYVDHDKQISVKWNDPNIGIKWPLKRPIMSARDKK